ncbi:hypothetical protein FFRU_011830 [Fructobacillus fructosus]|nr:hypothetical protein FFRU_011830 [Fructobacillus fructosus]
MVIENGHDRGKGETNHGSNGYHGEEQQTGNKDGTNHPEERPVVYGKHTGGGSDGLSTLKANPKRKGVT